MKIAILILAIVCTVIGIICAFNGLMMSLPVDLDRAGEAILTLLIGAASLGAALWLLKRIKP